MSKYKLFVGFNEGGNADYDSIFRMEDVRVLEVKSRRTVEYGVQYRLLACLDTGRSVPLSEWISGDEVQARQEEFIMAWTGTEAPYESVFDFDSDF